MAEYTPWFIKHRRDDLIARYRIPLDEYPKRCVEQMASWQRELAEYQAAPHIEITPSREYASRIMNALWSGEPEVIYGNVRNAGLIDNLPQGCCVEVPCLVDANGIQPTRIGSLPSHGGADADQCQCADAGNGGSADGKPRADIPCRTARSAYGCDAEYR